MEKKLKSLNHFGKKTDEFLVLLDEPNIHLKETVRIEETSAVILGAEANDYGEEGIDITLKIDLGFGVIRHISIELTSTLIFIKEYFNG